MGILDELIPGCLGVTGVYVLSLCGKPVYVGKSVDVFSRVLRHQKQRKISFDRFGFFPVKSGEADIAEHLLIFILKPRFNENLKHSKVRRLEISKATVGEFSPLVEKLIEIYQGQELMPL